MTLITKALMCQPDYFQVNYQINPWMEVGSVNQLRATDQWQKLKHTLELLGAQVEVVTQQPELPDMVFAADQGIVRHKQVLLSRFYYPERQGESSIYHHWFSKHGYQIESVSDTTFEGGEYLRWQDGYFVGVGFRTQLESVPQLEAFLQASVTPLELIHERFYHLDTCLLPLDETTALFYPPAFSVAARATLKRLVPQLIPLTDEEAYLLGANGLVFGRTVVLSAPNPSLYRRLGELGFQAITVDLSEFIKAGGGAHCLVLPLEYQSK